MYRPTGTRTTHLFSTAYLMVVAALRFVSAPASAGAAAAASTPATAAPAAATAGLGIRPIVVRVRGASGDGHFDVARDAAHSILGSDAERTAGAFFFDERSFRGAAVTGIEERARVVG